MFKSMVEQLGEFVIEACASTGRIMQLFTATVKSIPKASGREIIGRWLS